MLKQTVGMRLKPHNRAYLENKTNKMRTMYGFNFSMSQVVDAALDIMKKNLAFETEVVSKVVSDKTKSVMIGRTRWGANYPYYKGVKIYGPQK